MADYEKKTKHLIWVYKNDKMVLHYCIKYVLGLYKLTRP
ncbi:hypothetical protein CCACVL1_31045 [Corchorus capsularis]|uniref:Uncharacterized protein n=1 Tax=Corchorus capsularis TaxID=210143 RepID=A0A1R3FU65_COCAP|nr:hypothetical protein CCACVL1_31045 [Corchorus capsularis]